MVPLGVLLEVPLAVPQEVLVAVVVAVVAAVQVLRVVEVVQVVGSYSNSPVVCSIQPMLVCNLAGLPVPLVDL